MIKPLSFQTTTFEITIQQDCISLLVKLYHSCFIDEFTSDGYLMYRASDESKKVGGGGPRSLAPLLPEALMCLTQIIYK